MTRLYETTLRIIQTISRWKKCSSALKRGLMKYILVQFYMKESRTVGTLRVVSKECKCTGVNLVFWFGIVLRQMQENKC